jgi:hypothetical protein
MTWTMALTAAIAASLTTFSLSAKVSRRMEKGALASDEMMYGSRS